MRVDKGSLRRFLVSYHHLTDDSSLKDNEEILAYIKKVGCIQFDPLDVVGRNPDLVLQSRSKSYKKGDIGRLLYEERQLFDVWDKCMSISHISDWPYFSRFRERMMARYDDVKAAVKEITAYLETHECACSSDFIMEEKVSWHYGNQRMAKAALEFMCYTGIAVVHHKKGSRRYYCLAKDFVPESLLNLADPNESQLQYNKWQVLRRIRSIGVLWNRGGDGWLGLMEFKSADRNQGFAELLKDGIITELKVDELKHSLYIATDTLPLLKEAVISKNQGKITCRIIAPLDNFIWERNLIKEIFHFDYKWEVYVPAEKRKYGYYVLPVLCGDKFIGRIKLRTNKEKAALIVEQFWWEKDVAPLQKYKQSLDSCLKRFMRYNLCKEILFECEW